MNYPPPATPPFGQGGYPPPPGQPPVPPGWMPPAGPPPKRPGPGRTIAWLAAGLVLVLALIGGVALIVRSGDSEGADEEAGGGAHDASCEAYADVVLSSEVWAASELDPDKLQKMYDAALADITDETVEELVKEEATTVVSYYRAVAEWKQSMQDALSRGEYPDTELPAEITAQQSEIPKVKGAVIEECKDTWPAPDEPLPSISERTLISPSPAELGETPSWMDEN